VIFGRLGLRLVGAGMTRRDFIPLLTCGALKKGVRGLEKMGAGVGKTVLEKKSIDIAADFCEIAVYRMSYIVLRDAYCVVRWWWPAASVIILSFYLVKT